MKRKIRRISYSVLFFFVAIGVLLETSFTTYGKNIFDDDRREVLTDLNKWTDANPNDTIPDNAHGRFAMMDSFSADEIIYLYENGKFNIHHLAMQYVDKPIKYKKLESFALQSEYYEEYVKLFPMDNYIYPKRPKVDNTKIREALVAKVFDADYYATTYPDVASLVNDKNALLNHYIQFGIYEGRNASATFNATIYRDANPDLSAVYGDNLVGLIEHYANIGINENRKSY